MCETLSFVWKALVELVHLGEMVLYGGVHLGLSITYVSKRRFLLIFFLCFSFSFFSFYLKSTSSAIRDLGSRSSSRRKDALVRCVCAHVCESIMYICVEFGK